MQLGKLNIQKVELQPFLFTHNFQTRLFVQYKYIVEKTEIGRNVFKTLSEDQRVIALKDKMISHGSSAQRFDVRKLAMWFLYCANEYGSEIAERNLELFLNSEEISVINTLWVSGIEVDQPIILNNGYIINPASHMPDSQDKEVFLQHRIGPFFDREHTPKCAIIKPCRVKKICKDDPSSSKEDNQEYWKTSSELYNISLILNALNGVSCLPYYSTSYVESTTPLGPFSSSGGGSTVYDVLVQGSTQIPSESKLLIDNLLKKYTEYKENERSRIQLILNRLSQAKRRAQIEDKILDLGIAMEMLLLEDNHNNDQLSLSFRLRGSWLTGKSADDRINKFELLKDIYSYRSQVAHSGVLCKGKATKIENVRKNFLEYQLLAEEICQKIIIEGKPDWNALVLGAI